MAPQLSFRYAVDRNARVDPYEEANALAAMNMQSMQSEQYYLQSHHAAYQHKQGGY
jgi:hypothetical protein